MKYISLFAALLVAACSSFLAVNDKSQQIVLKSLPAVENHVIKLPHTLVVALPVSAPRLDANRIILIRNQTYLDHFAGLVWAEALPKMVQSALIESLENTKAFESVTTDTTGITGDWRLVTEIRHFEAEYANQKGGPVIHIKIASTLSKTPGREIGHSFTAEVTEPAFSNTKAAIVQAMHKAFEGTLQSIASQTIQFLSQ